MADVSESDVYKFFYGKSFTPIRRSEMLLEFRQFLDDKAVRRFAVYGGGPLSDVRVTLTMSSDGGVRIESQSPTQKSLFVSVVEFTRCGWNSIYPKSQLYGYYRSIQRTLARYTEYCDKELYQIVDPFLSISNSDLRQLSLLNVRRSRARDIFLKVLYVYLGRLPNQDDLVRKSGYKPPVLDVKEMGLALDTGGTPEVVVEFSRRMREVVDLSNDPGKRASREVFSESFNEVAAALGKGVSSCFSTDYRLLDLYTFTAHASELATFDSRILMHIRAARQVSENLFRFFSFSVSVDLDSIISNTSIRRYDELHALNAYFSVISTYPGVFRAADQNQLLVLRLNEIASQQFMDANSHFTSNALTVTAVIMTYFSVYSTSRRRVEGYRSRFSVIFLGKPVDLDFSFVPSMLVSFRRLVPKGNALRKYCRGFANLTYRVRRENRVYYNVWGCFYEVPQHLCFDTVNCVSIDVIADDDRQAVCLLTKWITSNSRPVRGTDFSRQDRSLDDG